MKKYARIYGGLVVEFFETADDISKMFHPDFVWIEVTGMQPMPQEQWRYDGERFTPPEPPSEDAVMVQIAATKSALMAAAASAIAPLQDAVDLDIATEEETASLRQWKLYRVSLNRIEEQEGFPTSFQWPTLPS